MNLYLFTGLSGVLNYSKVRICASGKNRAFLKIKATYLLRQEKSGNLAKNFCFAYLRGREKSG